MSIIKIGTTEIPIKIDGYDWEIEDISSEDSGMMISGKTWKDIIRRRRKLYLVCAPLTDAQISALLTVVEEQAIFPLTYKDPKLGDTTKSFYCGNRKARLAMVANDEGLWEGLSFNVIEE